MTAADSGSKTPKKANQRLNYFLTTLKVMNRCRKCDAEELPLQQIFDDVCRTVETGGNDVER